MFASVLQADVQKERLDHDKSVLGGRGLAAADAAGKQANKRPRQGHNNSRWLLPSGESGSGSEMSGKACVEPESAVRRSTTTTCVSWWREIGRIVGWSGGVCFRAVLLDSRVEVGKKG